MGWGQQSRPEGAFVPHSRDADNLCHLGSVMQAALWSLLKDERGQRQGEAAAQ